MYRSWRLFQDLKTPLREAVVNIYLYLRRDILWWRDRKYLQAQYLPHVAEPGAGPEQLPPLLPAGVLGLAAPPPEARRLEQRHLQLQTQLSLQQGPRGRGGPGGGRGGGARGQR